MTLKGFHCEGLQEAFGCRGSFPRLRSRCGAVHVVGLGMCALICVFSCACSFNVCSHMCVSIWLLSSFSEHVFWDNFLGREVGSGLLRLARHS